MTRWTAAHQTSLFITISWSSLKLMSIQPPHPLSPLLLLPSIFPSISVFSNKSVLHIRWPNYWSFSFSISPSNECSGLISFRIDWLDLLSVQGTLKSLLQHHSSKAVKGRAKTRGWLLSGEGPQPQLMAGPVFSMVKMIAFWGNYLEPNKKYVFKKGFWGNLSHETMCWIMVTVLHMPVGHSKF